MSVLLPLRFCDDLPSCGRLNKLLGDVVISQGGVVPFINPEVRNILRGSARHSLSSSSSFPPRHKRARRTARRFRVDPFCIHPLLYYLCTISLLPSNSVTLNSASYVMSVLHRSPGPDTRAGSQCRVNCGRCLSTCILIIFR